MGILLIGASGRTGSLVLTEALSRGHSVTALVHDPTSVSFLSASQRQSLTIVQGTPLSPADVDRVFSSAPPTDRISSIIVTLSARRASDSPFAKPVSPPRLLADCHANLVAAMKTHPEVKKIVTMSAFGVGDSFVELPWAFRLLFRKSNMAAQFADHDATDREVKASGVSFVLVRPVRLSEGEKKTVAVKGDMGKGVALMASVSRKSVAGFLVDAVESGVWDRRTPVICE